MTKKSKSKSSLAAKKGWITRRANLRSESAKKGWITRRANLRSEAAKKGWITRRENLRKKEKKARKRVLKTEYQVNVRYEPMRGPEIQVQISAIGPSNRTRQEVLDIIEIKMYEEEEEGEKVPKEWTLHIVFWEKIGKQSFGDDETAWKHLASFYPKAEKTVYDKTKKKEL
jgi:hypothetical protein